LFDRSSGGDFHVDVRPQHHDEQTAGDKTITECTSPTPMGTSPTLLDSALCLPASIVVVFVN
jgi:hypothetical protein